MIAETEKRITPEGKVQIMKCLINNKTEKRFKNSVQKMTWDDIISSKQTDSAYQAFLKKFPFLYDKVSEKFVVTVKSKTIKNPWITKLIVKSSKTKQRLYHKFLKSKSYVHEIRYKNYRNFTRKCLVTANLPPKHLILNNRNIFDQKTIANSFNQYFVNVGPKLASEIPQLQRSFEMYLNGFDSSFEEVTLSDEEMKTAFFSLKGGFD